MQKNAAAKQQNRCHICKKIITGNSYKFNSHLYQHKAVKARFKCSVCSKEFFRSDTFSRHLEGHRGITNKKVYICDYCDRSFAVKRNLALHLKIHDDHLGYKFKCIACGVSYCEERLLRYHIRKDHYNLKDKDCVLKREVNETWVERVTETQTYVQMTKINNNVVSIKKIATMKKDDDSKMKITDRNKKFKEYISSVFAQSDKSHYSKAICDYCKKEMLKKSLLSHIRERHLKLRKFHCPECKKSFNRHYQLVGHVCGQVRKKKRKNIQNLCYA